MALVETIAALDPDKPALERSATLDSTTSSQPSSSDSLNKKTTTPKRIRSQSEPSTTPSGGQPGDTGPTLTSDHVVDRDPSVCAGCAAALTETDRHGTSICWQVFDRPEPQPLEVTEHRAHRCLCSTCSTVTGAVFQTGVTAPVQYGPLITAWVSDLLHVQVSSETKLADLMSNRFAVPITTATIAAVGWCTAQRFEEVVDQVVDRIRTVAPVKHLDETGVRIEGRTRWLHLLCTLPMTMMPVTLPRGHALRGLQHASPARPPGPDRHRKGRRVRSMHRRLERARRAAHIARETGRDVPG